MDKKKPGKFIKVLKSKKCQSILKSGKRKGELCSKSCINKHCGRHQKIKLVHPGCSVILKSGKRKGKNQKNEQENI